MAVHIRQRITIFCRNINKNRREDIKEKHSTVIELIFIISSNNVLGKFNKCRIYNLYIKHYENIQMEDNLEHRQTEEITIDMFQMMMKKKEEIKEKYSKS